VMVAFFLVVIFCSLVYFVAFLAINNRRRP
jgi:hypothetical protein